MLERPDDERDRFRNGFRSWIHPAESSPVPVAILHGQDPSPYLSSAGKAQHGARPFPNSTFVFATRLQRAPAPHRQYT